MVEKNGEALCFSWVNTSKWVFTLHITKVMRCGGAAEGLCIFLPRTVGGLARSYVLARCSIFTWLIGPILAHCRPLTTASRVPTAISPSFPNPISIFPLLRTIPDV